jgi:hypothetical protein
MEKILGLLFLGLLSTTAIASENLSMDALRDGLSHGPATQEQADTIMAQTHSTSPISMSVKVLHRYTQQGCARLDYIVRQDHVQAKDGSYQKLVMQWQMNLCEDGSAPLEPLVIESQGASDAK